MSISGGPDIVNDGLVFAWDGMNRKCWDGTSSTHYDLIGGGSGTKQGANSLSIENSHISFSGAGTRVCYIEFTNTNITVPTGNTGTWFWAHYFSDSGDFDHPNFGKETTNVWAGTDGFVFGTGYGTDGPRWGIGGTAYTVYSTTDTLTGDYRVNVWQMYCVTYNRNTTGGLKTYLLDSQGFRLVDSRTTPDSAIGSNTNSLHIGATNSRGGNWNGYMDFLYMYNSELTSNEVLQNFNALRSRFNV